MAVWGKILGAFFGFLLGNFIGLLLGLYFGHKFDVAWRNAAQGRVIGSRASKRSYFLATYAVMGHLAKAKGHVTEQDIRIAATFMDAMKLQGQTRIDAQDAFRDGKDPEFPLEDVLRQVRQYCNGQYDLLRLFLEIQIQVAFTDEHIHPAEYHILVTVAQGLGFSRAELEAALSRAQGSSVHNKADELLKAYKLLGVEESADMKTIKRAYRKQMNEHHPDKLAATGLPPEMMEVAKQKTQEIQAAYDLIEKNRKNN